MSKTLREILIQENLMLSQNPFGTDKGDHKSYVEKFYEEAFCAFRDQPVKLLEIGFRHGASLALWSSYFKSGFIVGIDNYSDEYLKNSRPNSEWISRQNVRTISADAYDPNFVASLGTEFDIIIDDGPHSLRSQKSAISLYLSKLRPGGLMIIEDIQSRGKLILFSFSRLVPWSHSVQVLDFRADGKGDDNVLFVIQRKDTWQGLNRLKSYVSSLIGIRHELWLLILRTIRKKLG
jgi:hypothetical protein